MIIYKNIKIIDCFIFYNELNILDMRLKELDDYVDYFILVESTKTFSNNDKKLYFNENKDKFSKYLNKIIHIIVDDMPSGEKYNDNWNREKYQRDAIKRGINKIELNNNDIIFITDVDEIIDINLIKTLKNINTVFSGVMSLNMDFYYYNLNCKLENIFDKGKVLNYDFLQKLNSIDDIRMLKAPLIQRKCGWHFSYFGNVDFIINKIKSFSHQEYNASKYLDKAWLDEAIKTHKDIFFRNDCKINYIPIETNDYLPINYLMLLEDKEKYFDQNKYTFTYDWFLGSEIKRFIHNYVEPDNLIKFLEIGSYEGLSSVYFSDMIIKNSNSILYCVDSYDLSDSTTPLNNKIEINFLNNIKKSKNYHKIKFFKNYSDDFFKFNNQTFNFIYVDGSHVPEQITRDLENAFKILDINGIMWMDDYMGGDGKAIKNTMDNFVELYKDKIILIHKGYQLAFKKIKN